MQAVNGLGVVTLADNLGSYYRVGEDAAAQPDPDFPPLPTALDLVSPPASGVYGSQATVTAQLSFPDYPGVLAGNLINFGLAGKTLSAVTDSSGRASVTFDLRAKPGAYQVTASYVGTIDTNSPSQGVLLRSRPAASRSPARSRWCTTLSPRRCASPRCG